MSEDKIQMFRDAEAIEKLTKPPIPVDVGIYKLNETEDATVQDGSVKAWMHRLDWKERNYIRSKNAQMYKFLAEQGEEKEVILHAVGVVVTRMTVYHSLRRGSAECSERFFPNAESIMEYPMEEGVLNLYKKYNEQFALSEKEWGNWLRARSLETSSVLPVSAEAHPLDEKSQN